jgi:hypothetical protein
VFVVLVWWQEDNLEVDIDTNLNHLALLEAKCQGIGHVLCPRVLTCNWIRWNTINTILYYTFSNM